jgi:hypothetical protein
LDISIIGTVVKIDSVRNEFTIRCPFLTEEHLKCLEEHYTTRKSIKFVVKTVFRKLKTYPQLKRFFAMLKAIIIDVGWLPNSENMSVIRKEYVEPNFFPKKEKNINFIEQVHTNCDHVKNFNMDFEEPLPLKSLTVDQLAEVMNRIEGDYSKVFSKKDWYNFYDN